MRKRFFGLLGLLALTAPALSGVLLFGAASPASATPVGKVMVIMGENHYFSQVDGHMSYLNGLASLYRVETNYNAETHPSEPNYIDIAFGDTMGDTADHDPATSIAGQTVFGQAFAHGGTGGLYAEDMTSNCKQANGTAQVGGADAYAVKHNPWASASDTAERNECNVADVPMGTYISGNLKTAITNGALPNVGMMVPNQCNDAHQTGTGCGLPAFDDWLNVWIHQLQAGSDYTSGNLLIVVTFDEGSGTNQKVYTVLIAKGTKAQGGTEGEGVDSTTYTHGHESLSQLLSATTGQGGLRNAASATTFPK